MPIVLLLVIACESKMDAKEPFSLDDETKKVDDNKKIYQEDAFKDAVIPPWTCQITIRAVVTSFV